MPSVQWRMTEVFIVPLRPFVFWKFVGYKPNEPQPVKRMGITYTIWGARRCVRKAMFG